MIGVDVQWRNQHGNTYDQKLGAVLASSDVPDVVVVPSWNMMGKIPGAIVGKFADLGPYLSGDKVKEYPNLAAIPSDAWSTTTGRRGAMDRGWVRPRGRRAGRWPHRPNGRAGGGGVGVDRVHTNG